MLHDVSEIETVGLPSLRSVRKKGFTRKLLGENRVAQQRVRRETTPIKTARTASRLGRDPINPTENQTVAQTGKEERSRAGEWRERLY